MKQFNYDIALVSVTLMMLAAIACAPRRNSDLDRVQNELAVLQRDQTVVAIAPTELNDANVAVSRAQTSWETTKDTAEVEHLSYLADQRIEIAKIKASQRISENQAISYNQGRQNLQTLAELNKTDTRGALALAPETQVTTTIRTKEFSRNFPGLISNETSRGYVVTLNDAIFLPDSSVLAARAGNTLLPLSIYLRNNPGEIVYLEGYLDDSLSPSRALDLSERRASAVRDYIIGQGVSPNRISAKGLGSQFPVASNSSVVGRLQNRRVEVVLK